MFYLSHAQVTVKKIRSLSSTQYICICWRKPRPMNSSRAWLLLLSYTQICIRAATEIIILTTMFVRYNMFAVNPGKIAGPDDHVGGEGRCGLVWIINAKQRSERKPKIPSGMRCVFTDCRKGSSRNRKSIWQHYPLWFATVSVTIRLRLIVAKTDKNPFTRRPRWTVSSYKTDRTWRCAVANVLGRWLIGKWWFHNTIWLKKNSNEIIFTKI